MEGGVITKTGGGGDGLIEDWVGQDTDQQDFPLSDRETEEVDGDFVGGGV